jgi:hypothetical protein
VDNPDDPKTPAAETITLAAPSAAEQASQRSSALAFWLVMSMLGALLLLVTMLLVFPTWWSSQGDEKLDFYKWALTALLGTFGAWIGAGAAYFFGRENLRESSRSTEAALRIQQSASHSPRAERIKDIALTAMNSEFMFGADKTKDDVLKGLDKHTDYWFVPVLDATGNGKLDDVIHGRVFWDARIGNDKISQVRSALDTDAKLQDLKLLHGDAFFVKASLDDMIADVSALMGQKGAVVGVVVGDNGKPTHCFTKQLLSTLATN